MGKLNVDGTEIQVLQIEEDDYISLTDMVRKIDNGPALIEKWLRNKNTIEFLGIWEEMYNADFDSAAYEEIMLEAGLNRFIMSVKQWVSPQFKLYLIKEFERLKKEEQALLGWSAKRELAKINYRIHTDAIKVNLIPLELTLQQTSVIYASEADVLNMALFGMTAKQWRDKNPDKKGNIRDYASINELICLSNMENINAVLIEDGLSQKERLIKLNKIAIHQMSILEEQTTKVLNCGNFECTEVWDGVFYKKLSDYPKISDWEIRTIIEFIEYEKRYGRECVIECEDSQCVWCNFLFKNDWRKVL